MDFGDGEHSPEMEMALKKFEEACNALENEKTRLLDLEERRKRLQSDLESLRNEILVEQSQVQSAIKDGAKTGIYFASEGLKLNEEIFDELFLEDENENENEKEKENKE